MSEAIKTHTTTETPLERAIRLYRNDITLAEAAAMAGMSPTEFENIVEARKLKMESGIEQALIEGIVDQECYEPEGITLLDRFQDLFSNHLNWYDDEPDRLIHGYSVSPTILQQFTTISCLNCFLCENDKLEDKRNITLPYQGTPILAWNGNVVAYMAKGSSGENDRGKVFRVFSQTWWDEGQHGMPNIEYAGNEITLD